MKKNKTFSVNIEPELRDRLEATSSKTGVAINTIARAAILAAVETCEKNGFLPMPMQFKNYDITEQCSGSKDYTLTRIKEEPEQTAPRKAKRG